MEADTVAAYLVRVIGGLAVCLIALFASRAWAATLVVAGAMTLAASVAAVRLAHLPADSRHG